MLSTVTTSASQSTPSFDEQFVRFGSDSDVGARNREVRFTPRVRTSSGAGDQGWTQARSALTRRDGQILSQSGGRAKANKKQLIAYQPVNLALARLKDGIKVAFAT